MIYADHAATAPLRPEALAAMLPLLGENFGNPSSTHSAGQAAARALAAARGEMAAALGCIAREITFTSGGTEADNQALRTAAALGAASGKRHLVVGAIEHPAVLRTLAALSEQGFAVTLVPPDAQGVVRAQAVAQALRPDTAAVSVMYANNETGTLQPAAEIAALCRARGVLCHTDAVQAAGQLPLSFAALDVDFLSLSAHKFGGPKGTGALIARRGITPVPLLYGGRQERGARAGTENTAAIAGMAAALTAACRALPQTVPALIALRERLIAGLSKLPAARLTGGGAPRAPGIVHFCFAGVESETLLLLLDEAGVCASAGSACEAGALEPSHVLRSMGVPEIWAHGAVRFSLGAENTPAEIDAIICAVREIVTRLRENG